MSYLAKANKAFSEKKYEMACMFYKKAKKELPDMKHFIEFNESIARKYGGLKNELTFGVSKETDKGRCGTLINAELSIIVNYSKLSGIDKEAVDVISESEFFDKDWYLNKNFPEGPSSIDAKALAIHYYFHGASRNFDPSESFSTRFYLERYKSVARAGFNPLVHYHKYGRRNGHVINVVSDINLKSEHGPIDVYLSCWLRNKESVHDGILNLIRKFKSEGFRVKLITQSEPLLSENGVEAYNVSFSILDSLVYDDCHEHVIPKKLMNELFSITGFWSDACGVSLDLTSEEIDIKLSEAYSFWKQEFLSNNPGIVIVWGSTCAISRLHIWLCNELGIPFVVMERGHFPETIGIDFGGQFAHNQTYFLPDCLGFDHQRYNSIAEWVRSSEQVPYERKNLERSSDYFDTLRAGSVNKPLIFFIGVNEIGSGIAYDSELVSESHSATYHSSKSALEALYDACKIVFDDFVLLFKPHPADRSDYSPLNMKELWIDNDANINTLISNSDVCVSMSTTALARCIIESKPIITMSCTDIDGFDIAYEYISQSSLVQCVRDAYNKKDFDSRVINGQRFITSLFNRKLFLTSYNDGVAHGVDSLGHQLSNKIRMRRSLGRSIGLGKQYLIPDCGYRKLKLLSFPEFRSLKEFGLDIIIPVYKDVEITRKAIKNAYSAIEGYLWIRLVIVNDDSPEPGMAEMLAFWKPLEQVVVLCNRKNLGFSGSVNSAISFSKDRDVILLNSDAIVPFDFIFKMVRAAYSSSKIATVTPFSNNAGIAYSIPTVGEPLSICEAEEFVQKRNEILSENAEIVVEMPVGHGFCMYIRRSAISSVGYFDELAFGKGYSEEIDFCLRLRQCGFLNVACINLFVGHVGGISFGDSANEIKIKNREIIKDKYPNYFSEIRALKESDPLASHRLGLTDS